MPERDWNGLLSTAVHTVLETMFFATPTGPVEPELVAASPLLASRLSFRGDPSGSLGLCVSMDAARQLAAGFLAEEEADLTDTRVEDVVCEMTNMLCGSVVSNLENEQRFHLSSPELVPPEDLLLVRPGVRQVARQSFLLEAGSLSVLLDVVASE